MGGSDGADDGISTGVDEGEGCKGSIWHGIGDGAVPIRDALLFTMMNFAPPPPVNGVDGVEIVEGVGVWEGKLTGIVIRLLFATDGREGVDEESVC
jgi:hypothetical protein